MFLSDINENEELKQPVYVISVAFRQTKNGKQYITGEVQDKSEVLKYNLWDIDSCQVLPQAGQYLQIIGRLELWGGSRQINLRAFTPLEKDEINEADFKKTTILSLSQMWEEFEILCSSFQDELVKFLVASILKDPVIQQFKKAPAATHVHNAWASGLLEHSLAVAKLSDVAVSHYNELYFKNKINRDIVVFCSLFHDIGKVWEYDYDSPGIFTTKTGELLGHIYLGTKKIEEFAQKYEGNSSQLSHILHVFLAHHGKHEWGAPVLPKTPEAIIVHYMDNVDTKLMNLWESLENCKDDFTQRNYIQENAKMYNLLK